MSDNKTKLGAFLEEHNIHPKRLQSASKHLEALRPEDRALRLAKRQSGDGDANKDSSDTKPRSGRPVNTPTLTRALEGKSTSGAAKTRILRAVNHLLAQRKKEPVELRALW